MTDNTTLDAAIVAAQELVYNNHERVVDPLDRTYARALIAKLIEGMERPDWFTTEEDIGWDAAISELSLMTGLEYEV
jgi:hypothetical protein